MLAPISSGRRDKGTSFKKLARYLTKERDPETGEEMFRGEMILSDNLPNFETMDLAMRGIAAHNPRCKDPLYHFQIAWMPGERPTRAQWEDAALRTIRDLGFEEHQYMVVAHDDKAHFHIHIMLNKVHPDTYRAHSPYRDMYTLDKAMRELEHEQGWKEAVGTFRWDSEKGVAVKNTWEERRALSERADHPSGKAAEMEHYHGAESLQTYAKGTPAADLQMVLARHNATWSDVHAMLYRHGLELRHAGHGGYTVHAIDSDLYVKASDVFRRAFSGRLNREATEKKLGLWREPAADRERGIGAGKYEKNPKREPNERQRKKEQREEAREALKRRFGVYRSECRHRQKVYTGTVRDRRTHLVEELKQAKQRIRSLDIPWKEQRVQLSRVVAEHVVQMRLLRVEGMRERLTLQGMSFQQWVMKEAESGNEGAAAQLRGWRYQDQRNAKKLETVIGSQRDAVHLFAGRPGDESEWAEVTHERLRELERNEEMARTIAATRWTVIRRSGDVHYTVAGALALVDRGKTISVLTTEEAAVVLALEMAVKKYGMVIDAQGGEQWKERVARVAARNDVFIQFTDARMRQIVFEEQMKTDRFRVMAKQLENLYTLVSRQPDTAFNLAGRDAAYVLAAGIYGMTRGRDVVNDLQRNMQPGETRSNNIKNIFQLEAKRGADGVISYTIRPLEGKGTDFLALVRDGAARMTKMADYQATSRTVPTREPEQKRERARNREKEKGLE